MTDSPRDEVTLTKGSVGVSGSASDEARELRLRAEYAESRLLRVAAALRIPDGARYLNDVLEYAECVEKNRAANAALTKERDELNARLVGLSADVSRLTAERDEWKEIAVGARRRLDALVTRSDAGEAKT